MKKIYVVAVGGANIDIHSRLLAPAVLRDSNPGTVSMSAGGVARNIGENMARLGLSCSLLTAVGNDSFGEHILSSCVRAGIDTNPVYISPNASSSVYLDINDCEGDMFLASSDMRVLSTLPEDYFDWNRELLTQASAIVADGNLTEKQISSLIDNKGQAPLIADPVSTAKVTRFLPFMDRISVFKPNGMELATITGIPCDTESGIVDAADLLLCKGLGRIVVSMGALGCYYADNTGLHFFSRPPRVERPVSATGAGDAFTAGLVCSLVNGGTPAEAVRLAMGCGAFAVQSAETIHPDISIQAVENYLGSVS